jgi:hypothetical protein
MPEDNANAPFDPAEFTAEELRLAREYLLALRSCGVAPTPMKVTVHDAWHWRWTAQGGEAACSRCVVTRTPFSMSVDCQPPADDAWFACTHAQYEAMRHPPQPDQLIEPPDDQAKEQ